MSDLRVVVVGECAGGPGEDVSQFTANWDADLAMELYPTWTSRGLLTEKLMDVEHFVDAVHGLLQCGATACIPTVVLTPGGRSDPVGVAMSDYERRMLIDGELVLGRQNGTEGFEQYLETKAVAWRKARGARRS